ncbi:hypothetical protein DPMN_139812 [Dreissena polymorpha]|uniref:Uncharacterized protein n=1 Tax=Dreissena polymorpha TaxID=45954 RepID=A0A9D4JL51_DREPO|nr:hypothetical protein DPMN_139812 [Dreissena polymorpha]
MIYLPMKGAPGLVMGPCIVQYQLEVNRCRNEEIIVKGNFGWARPMWAGRPRIDRIVIREVQYQFEVNLKAILNGCGLCGRVAPGLVMGSCIVEVDCIVLKEVQYQFEVYRCRNEEIIVKGNFGWAWPMWAGHPRINCIDKREVQYQFEVNRCRNVVKGNIGGRSLCGRGAPGLVMGPCIVEIDRIVIREVQYQFEDNRCRNEEIIFQCSSANSVGGDSGQDGRTDSQTPEITTISPRFSISVGVYNSRKEFPVTCRSDNDWT